MQSYNFCDQRNFYKIQSLITAKFYYFFKNLEIIIEFSIEKHWEIIFLYLHRKGPKFSIREIAKEVKCSQDTVKTWIQRYQETGDVKDKERQGRKRKTTEEEDLDIIHIAKKHRTNTLAEISSVMSRQRVDISLNIVMRRLNEEGLYKLQPLKKPLLLDNHRENRLK